MASARGGWDAAAFRRQCAIPPDQLAKLNSLPGWARAMQTASLDETPDGSPTPICSRDRSRREEIGVVLKKNTEKKKTGGSTSTSKHSEENLFKKNSMMFFNKTKE